MPFIDYPVFRPLVLHDQMSGNATTLLKLCLLQGFSAAPPPTLRRAPSMNFFCSPAHTGNLATYDTIAKSHQSPPSVSTLTANRLLRATKNPCRLYFKPATLLSFWPSGFSPPRDWDLVTEALLSCCSLQAEPTTEVSSL